MTIYLMDQSLAVDIFIDEADAEFEDDVCIRLIEQCPGDEKVFRGSETNLYITRDEARQLRDLLNEVVSEDAS